MIQKHVITTFFSQCNVRMSARQRKRHKSKEAYRDDLMKLYNVSRKRLSRTEGNSDSYDPK